MFDLEQSIAAWRQQMLAAGIQSPVPLEELESHLREEIEQQLKSGLGEAEAFYSATQKIGQTETLKTEFAKSGTTLFENFWRQILSLAGVSRHQLATNMSTINSNLEPRRTTYLKAAAVVLPAVFLWALSSVFVLPKLKEICATSDLTRLPGWILTAFGFSDFCNHNAILGSVLMLAIVIFLEWRSQWWSRHRRKLFGVAAFLLNLAVLILITVFLVLAVVAAAHAATLAHLQRT